MRQQLLKHKIFYSQLKIWAGILLAQIVLFYTLSYSDWAVNCASELFEKKKYGHQKLFGLLGFSVGDWLYILLVLYLIFLLILIFRKKYRTKALLKLLAVLNLMYFIYQLFWGLLYFQEPVSGKLPKDEINVAEAKILAEKYLSLCRQTRKTVREDRYGVFKVYDLVQLKQAVIEGQKAIPPDISIRRPTGLINFKPSVFGKAMGYSGILGYYNPFTAEAQYNPNVPSSSLPFTLAHESGHQLGFAREQEASFAAYLIGRQSPNRDLKYSVEFYALKSLLGYIYTEDPAFVKMTLHRYSPAMKRDRLYEKNYALSHQGRVENFFATTNDWFLKSNQQEGSITYSYFTELLIKYERTFK